MKKIINPVAGALLRDPNRVGGWHHAAIRTGDLIFVSGMVGVYPGTKTLGPTVEEQGRLVFANLTEGLEAHGGRLEDIVVTNLYFTDRKAQWPIYERIRRELLPNDPPTSTGVGVTELDLGAAMEVSVIAVVTSGE